MIRIPKYLRWSEGEDDGGCGSCDDGSCGDSSHDDSGPDYDGDDEE